MSLQPSGLAPDAPALSAVLEPSPQPANARRGPSGLALVLPAQLVMLAVVIVPTLIAIWLSLTDWSLTDGVPWYEGEFAWLWNYYDLWHDARFTGAVVRTCGLVLVSLAIELALAIALALLFLAEWSWRRLALAVIILPMMIVPVDAANAFFMLFNERGPINRILSLLSGRTVEFSWLSDPNWALLPILLVEVWQWTPFMFLLVLTGFLNLPQNQLRAARSLGASPARILLKISLPLLVPVISVALMIRGIEAFKIFDSVYILTRGGPGASTETISMFMYNAGFVYFRMGYVAAAGLVVLLVVIAMCLALVRPLRRFG